MKKLILFSIIFSASYSGLSQNTLVDGNIIDSCDRNKLLSEIGETESDTACCNPRLLKLKDQTGQIVKLRGRAISLNRYWWFNYCGMDIYVERMEELSNWTVFNHFRPMEISGILEEAVLPRLDQIALKENRDQKLYYIIRKASWTPISVILPKEESKTKN